MYLTPDEPDCTRTPSQLASSIVLDERSEEGSFHQMAPVHFSGSEGTGWTERSVAACATDAGA